MARTSRSRAHPARTASLKFPHYRLVAAHVIYQQRAQRTISLDEFAAMLVANGTPARLNRGALLVERASIERLLRPDGAG